MYYYQELLDKWRKNIWIDVKRNVGLRYVCAAIILYLRAANHYYVYIILRVKYSSW